MEIKKVQLPEKGLKALVLRKFINDMGFKFLGGIKVVLPGGKKVYSWYFVPPLGSYTEWELVNLVDKTIDWFCRTRSLKVPKEIWSATIKDELLIITEALGGKKEKVIPSRGKRMSLEEIVARRKQQAE